MPSNIQIWISCKERLKEKLNSHNYDSWIDPMEYVSCRASKLVLSVPSKFFVEWIEEHYKQTIIESVKVTSDTDVTLGLVIVAQEKAPAKTQKKPAEPKKISSQPNLSKAKLNEKYTLNKFVVGKSNEFCYAACKAITKNLGTTYNPLFLYGGVGLGKTHLMQAIGNDALEKNPDMRVLYISSEEFVNDLISSLQRGHMSSFRNRYRSLDLLLVDDIQFIAGKERTQEEFFHTFNTLFQEKKQIVLSSDKFPKEITNMEERLRSRFAWGLIADIQPPELEIKMAILQKIAKENGFTLGEEVSSYLGNKIKSNIRELEGCFSRVMAYSSLTGRNIDLEMTKETLKGIYDETTSAIDIKDIQKAVADFYKLKVLDLKSKDRKKNIALPRHVAIYLCREYTNNSLPEIGRAFGGRDHTTIMHSVQKVKQDVNDNTKLYNEIKEIKRIMDL